MTNKHLLPVYDRPMIYYPLSTLVKSGVTDICIVSGKGHAGHFLELLGDGRKFGCRLTYEVQEEAGGIAQALGLCEEFVGKCQRCVVILGDNIFEEDFRGAIADFLSDRWQRSAGAMCLLKEAFHPEKYGVAEVKNGVVVSIEEKPRKPKAKTIITGAYLFDDVVWSVIRQLRPSKRGELEITDVLRDYMEHDRLMYRHVRGYWYDAGEIDSLFETAFALRQIEVRRRKELGQK